MRDEVKECITEAISVMEDAVNRTKADVARIAKRPDHSDAEIINTVIHNFSWALANSMQRVENAHRRNEDALLEKSLEDKVNSKVQQTCAALEAMKLPKKQ